MTVVIKLCISEIDPRSWTPNEVAAECKRLIQASDESAFTCNPIISTLEMYEE